jgi:large subunit ribosomal protein L28
MSVWIPKTSSISALISKTPAHYRKFLYELKYRPPAPVHYKVQPEWQRDKWGMKIRVESRPIPLTFPKESHQGLWGGEAVIKGYKKRKLLKRHFAHYWIPVLRRSIVYSEILDKYMAVVVTKRTLNLIDQAYGFDNYILKTPIVDLQSQLAFNLRRKMLLTLVRREMYPNDPDKQEEIYQKYREHIIPEDEAEWFGLSIEDALKKLKVNETLNKPVPLKNQLRLNLIQRLKEEKIQEAEAATEESQRVTPGWMTKFNPFSKKDASTSENK